MAARMKAAIPRFGSVHRCGAGGAALGEPTFGILALNLLLRRLALDEFAFGVSALLCARRRSGKSREGSDNQK